MNPMKLTFLSAAAAVVTACGGPLDEASFDQLDAPQMGQSQSALGEKGCATVIPDAVIDTPLDPGAYTQPYTATSSRTTYDHPGECPKQFVVEVRQTIRRNLQVLGGWAQSESLPNTEAACLKARSEVGLYGSTSQDSWALLGTAKYKGVWYPEGMFIAHCELVAVAGQVTIPDTIVSGQYEKLRVASRAFLQENFSLTYVRAYGGVLSIQ